MLISFSLSLFRRVFALPNARVMRGDANGSAEARRGRLASIVHEHLDAVYRTARRLGVSDTDMEDALQDVLLVLLRRLDDIEPGKERAFVVAVAAGVAANRRRHERRHPEDASEMLDELGTSAGLGVLGQASTGGSRNGEQHVERSRRLALLEKGLASMTEAQRAAFVLFELEQLTAREIAEELGVSTFTVVSRVRRAREVLTRTLRAEYGILRDEAENDEPEGEEP
jgi:RNA polymerase sigma-70 factor (ECF subfamily)